LIFQQSYIEPELKYENGDLLGCWKWFDGVLKEADVKATDKNKGKIDEVIHQYIGE
jgi:hypothetical protein